MRVYLTGFMGAGKTTVGKKLANRLGWSFVDLDRYIEKKHQTTITDIFNNQGESTFRLYEKMAIEESLNWNRTVISTGGGTPCYNNLMQIMKENGICVYMKMPVNAIVSRLLKSKDKRPLIQDFSVIQLTEFVKKSLLEREVYYSQAHLTFEVLKKNSND